MKRITCLLAVVFIALVSFGQYSSNVLYKGDGYKIIQVKPYVNPFSYGGSMNKPIPLNSNSNYTSSRNNNVANNNTRDYSDIPSSKPKEIPAYETYWRKTSELFDAGNYDSSLARIMQSKYWNGAVSGLTLSPDWLGDYISLHMASLYYKGKYQDAVTVYTSFPGIKQNIVSADRMTTNSAPYFLGLCLFETGKVKEAIELWERFKNVKDALSGGQTSTVISGEHEVRILLNLGIFNYFLRDYINASHAIGTALFIGKNLRRTQDKIEERTYNYFKVLQGHSLIESYNAEEGLKMLEDNPFEGFTEEEEFEIISKGYLYAGQYEECEDYCMIAKRKTGLRSLASLRLADCYLFQNKWDLAGFACDFLLIKDSLDLYALYRKSFADLMEQKPFFINNFDQIISSAKMRGTATEKNLNMCEAIKVFYYVRKNNLNEAKNLLNERIKNGEKLTDPVELYILGSYLKAENKNNDSKSMMNYAVRANFTAAKDFFKQNLGGYNEDMNINTTLNSIYEAIKNKDIPALKKFIAMGDANIDLGNGYTPLHAACQMADEIQIKLLLNGGSNPSALMRDDLPVYFFLDYNFYLKKERKCLSNIFILLKNAGMKITTPVMERYLLMSRDQGPYERLSKDFLKCEKEIKKILESCIRD